MAPFGAEKINDQQVGVSTWKEETSQQKLMQPPRQAAASVDTPFQGRGGETTAGPSCLGIANLQIGPGTALRVGSLGRAQEEFANVQLSPGPSA